jgi:hypothetical protein
VSNAWHAVLVRGAVVVRQVNKLKGQQHQLQWKEQPDFVRMAAKLNAIIIPFAAVGGKSSQASPACCLLCIFGALLVQQASHSHYEGV